MTIITRVATLLIIACVARPSRGLGGLGRGKGRQPSLSPVLPQSPGEPSYAGYANYCHVLVDACFADEQRRLRSKSDSQNRKYKSVDQSRSLLCSCSGGQNERVSALISTYSSLFNRHEFLLGSVPCAKTHSTSRGPEWHIHILTSELDIDYVIFRLTLSLPRVIHFKFLLQPHQKYYITQYEEFGFS